MKKIIWLCVSLILFSSIATARDNLILATGVQSPLVSPDGKTGFLSDLVKEAFHRMKLGIEIIVLPAERVLINANRGIEDGCLLRIKGLEKKYPNLVRVPERIMFSEFVGYTTKKNVKGNVWDRLNEHTVAYITGWKIFDKYLSQHQDLIKVTHADQLFALLKQKRADTILYERWQGMWYIKKLNIAEVQLMEPPYARMEMFMYLNKKHRNIIPILASTLAEIKKDGTYQKYYNQNLRSLLIK